MERRVGHLIYLIVFTELRLMKRSEQFLLPACFIFTRADFSAVVTQFNLKHLCGIKAALKRSYVSLSQT